MITLNKRLMLVDDEPDITFSFAIGLEDNGFKVYTFNDPLVALSNFKSDSYDLLILDIKMPQMTGIDLYKEIRKIDNKVKVCFLTAFDFSYKDLQEYSKWIIKKPIANDDLVKEVNRIMNC